MGNTHTNPPSIEVIIVSIATNMAEAESVVLDATAFTPQAVAQAMTEYLNSTGWEGVLTPWAWRVDPMGRVAFIFEEEEDMGALTSGIAMVKP